MQRRMLRPVAIWCLTLMLALGSSFAASGFATAAQVGTNAPKPPGFAITDLTWFCTPVPYVPPGQQLAPLPPTPAPSTDGAPIPGASVRPVGTPYPTSPPQSIPAGAQLFSPEPVLLADPPLQTDSTDPASAMIWGQWQMPLNSSLELVGPEGHVKAISGSVAVVSCGGDLVFSRTGGPLQEVVEANWGLIVDGTYPDGVTIQISALTSPVWVVAVDQTATAVAEVSVQGEGPALLVCGPATCWSWFNAEYTVDGGGSCYGSRCYGR